MKRRDADSIAFMHERVLGMSPHSAFLLIGS